MVIPLVTGLTEGLGHLLGMVIAAAKQIADTFGKLDVLVRKAGINVEGEGPPSGADLSAVHKVLDTNFVGTLRVTQAMLPLLKKAPSARIVNVSSELGSMTLNSDPAWITCRKQR